MTAPVIDPQVIAKIQKLMALTAERGASEHEAEIAAGHVQRLLAEHNLTLAAIEASGADTGAGGKRTKEAINRRQVYRWQRTLMGATAQLNFCLALERYDHSRRGAPVFNGYSLIGRVDNVATTKVMFEYLIQTIERLARADVGGDPSQFFTRAAHSFKEGCSHRLVERLKLREAEIIEQQAREARERDAANRHPAATTSNALTIVLSDVIQAEADFNNDVRYGYEPGTTARRRAEQAAKSAATEVENKRRFAEAVEMGMSADAAYWYAAGYDRNRAEELARPVQPKLETDAQRKKRQAREQRQDDAWRQRYHARQRREAARLDWGAYQRGHAAGKDVSLDRQIDGKNQSKIGRD
jgi:hypothetical protein